MNPIAILIILATLFVVAHNLRGKEKTIPAKYRDVTAEYILGRLGDLENYPDDTLAPYEEFRVDEKIYYFTPGGFLYRKDPGSEEVGGFFCGYLTDEVWRRRHDGG